MVDRGADHVEPAPASRRVHPSLVKLALGVVAHEQEVGPRGVAQRAGVGRIFKFKGMIVGLVGTLLGNVSAFVLCWLLKQYHFIELPKDVFYVSTLPVRVYGENFATVALVSIVICLLATIYPARQAAGLAPVEVIRYE